MKYNQIPENIIEDMNFMLGSADECEDIADILIAHGYERDADTDLFLLDIQAEDDEDLAVDIYKGFYGGE